MHKYKKHKLVPSIYGVIALINTSIHHTATKLWLIFTPSIIYMFTISLQRFHYLFFSLAYCNLHTFEIRRFKMSFYLSKKFGKQSRHRVRSPVPPVLHDHAAWSLASYYRASLPHLCLLCPKWGDTRVLQTLCNSITV